DAAGDVQELADQRVAQGVADADAGFRARDDVVGAQDGELLGDHRLLDLEGVLQLLHGAIRTHQQFENADADRMRQGLEEGGLERLQLLCRDILRVRLHHVVQLYYNI